MQAIVGDDKGGIAVRTKSYCTRPTVLTAVTDILLMVLDGPRPSAHRPSSELKKSLEWHGYGNRTTEP